MRSWLAVTVVAACGIVLAAGTQPVRAQNAIADFYRGKEISLIISTGVGGGVDTNARVLARHQISVQLAKVSTLGERVEDTFLVSGTELEKTATLVRLEQELLDVLKI